MVRVLVLSCFNRVRLFLTLWTVARQTAPSMGFSRQEYWTGLPCPPPGNLPDPGIKPASPVSPAMQETHVQSLGREDSLEEGMAIHSSSLAWRIPWTEEPGRLHTVCGVAKNWT